MAEDEKVNFKLDIDSKEFIEKILESKGVIAELGESKNLEGLIRGLGEAGLALGALGIAALAISKTFETVFEAEQIKAINQQFETLGKMAGIATDEMAEGLKKAANGLIDDTELLQIANGAIVQMGKSAEKLPELMELARKSSAVMGTDLKTTFENITRAVETGNARLLKHAGLTIDVEAAVRKFAAANNIAVNTISQAGRQQAILNEVLAVGGQRYKDVDANVKVATDSWTQFKVTMSQIGETLTLAFEKMAGPTVKSSLSALNEMANWAKDQVLASYGEGAEKSSAKVNILGRDLIRLQAELYELDKAQKSYEKNGALPGLMESSRSAIAKTTEEISKLKAEIATLEGSSGKKSKSGSGGEEGKPASAAEIADQKKVKENTAKFHSDMISMRESRVKQEMALAKNYADYEVGLIEQQKLIVEKAAVEKEKISTDEGLTAEQKAQKILAIEQSTQLQLDAIQEQTRQKLLKNNADILTLAESNTQTRIKTAENEAEFQDAKRQEGLIAEQRYQMQVDAIKENGVMTEEQKQMQLALAEEQYQQQRRQAIWATEDERIAALDNASKHAATNYDSMAAAAQLASAKSVKAWNDNEATINRTAGSFSSNMSSAFQKIADGSEDAQSAILKAVLSTIAQEATARGSMLILESIANPALLVPGLGLLALGGALMGATSAMGGAKKADVPAVAAPSTTGGGAGGQQVTMESSSGFSGLSAKDVSSMSTMQLAQVSALEKQTHKAVHINVQGHYFETEQTKMKLVEMIRESSDATDFTIKQVGES